MKIKKYLNSRTIIFAILAIIFWFIFYYLNLQNLKNNDTKDRSSKTTSIGNLNNFKDNEDSLEEYVTISELISLCNLPGKCGEKLPCEGKEFKIKGYVDFNNVFDKERYPQLPYEKFRIYDLTKTKVLEVWAVGDDNSGIFKKIYNNNIEPALMIFVKGKAEGIDIPMNTGCRRWLKLNIDNEGDISF